MRLADPATTNPGTNPKERLHAAFSAFARAKKEIEMLAVHAEDAQDDDRAEALQGTIGALHTARKHLRVATHGWIGAPVYDSRDREKPAEGSHYLQTTDETLRVEQEERLLGAFSALDRAHQDLCALAHALFAQDMGERCLILIEAARHTAQAHQLVADAAHGWLIPEPVTPRQVRPATSQDITEGRDVDSRGLVRVRDDEKLTDAERLAKWGYRLGEETVTPRQVRDAEKL